MPASIHHGLPRAEVEISDAPNFIWSLGEGPEWEDDRCCADPEDQVAAMVHSRPAVKLSDYSSRP
jgi:hypothetical protein